MKNIIRNPSYINHLGAIETVDKSRSPFGEVVTTARTPVIELNSVYGTSALRDKTTVSGSGAITSTGGELLLSTGATASSVATLESAEVGRYIPGYSAEIGLGLRIPTTPTGNLVAKWGGWNVAQDSGLYFQHDASGLYVVRLRAGVETEKVEQANWNIDKLDGTGKSGVNLDLSNGHIYQIKFTWYGYGIITFGVFHDVNGVQDFLPCHYMSGFNTTSVADPNMRIFTQADNGGSATDFDVYVGGRQYSIQGDYTPKYRFTADTRGSVSVGTTVEPLISFRYKSGFKNRSVKIAGYDVLNSGANDCYIQIRLDGTLTTPTWITPTNYTASETALEVDKSSTAISGGEVIWAGDIIGAGQNKSPTIASENMTFDIPEDSIISLCIATFASTTDITSAFRLEEEW